MKETTQRRILNAYRAGAAGMVDARQLHREQGNTDDVLDDYRKAARVTLAARDLDRSERTAK